MRSIAVAIALAFAITGCSSTSPSDSGDRNAPVDDRADLPTLPLTYDPVTDIDATSPGERVGEYEDRPSPSVVSVTPANGDNGGAVARGDRQLDPSVVTVTQRRGVTSERASVETEAAPLTDDAVELALIERQQELVAIVHAILDSNKSLSLTQRLDLPGHVLGLIAYHDLGVGELDNYRAALIDGFEKIENPSKGLRLRMEGLFHDLGVADRVGSLWPREAKTDRTEPKSDAKFEVTDIRPMRIYRDNKEREFSQDDLRRGDDIHILLTVPELTARPVAGGFEYKYSIEGFLYDDNDEYVGRQPLRKNEVDITRERHSPPIIRLSYVIPSKCSNGRYRLELKLTDEFSGDQDLVPLSIRVGAAPSLRSDP